MISIHMEHCAYCISCDLLALTVQYLHSGIGGCPWRPSLKRDQAFKSPPRNHLEFSVCLFILMWPLFEIWERISQKNILQVGGLRPFTLEFRVGWGYGSLEPAALIFKSHQIPGLLA